MDTLTDVFALAQQWLFEALVQPLALLTGQANLLEKAYEGTGWLLVGLIQIAVMLLLIGPMQRLWPPSQPSWLRPMRGPASWRTGGRGTCACRRCRP